MAVVKSNLLKKLANNYPNFLRKDLSKLLDITLSEIENSLRKGERVELRDIFTLETRVQKARISRNPKTNEKIQKSLSKKYSLPKKSRSGGANSKIKISLKNQI